MGSVCESMRVEMDGKGFEEMGGGRVTDVEELDDMDRKNGICKYTKACLFLSNL